MTKKDLYYAWVGFIFEWKNDLEDISMVTGIEDIYETVFGQQFDSAMHLFFATFDFTEDMRYWFYDMIWSEDGVVTVDVIDEVNHAYVSLDVDYSEFYDIFLDTEHRN